MPTRNTTIRLATENDENVKRAFREVGATGDKALDQITKGTKPASRGLKAVDGAARSASNGLESMASRAGPLGGVLGGLGKGGLLAGAAIGGLAIGLKKAGDVALDAVADFDEIGKTADKIGVATESLQELRFAAGSLAGMTSGQLDTALQQMSRKMGDAARGVGSAVTLFDDLGVTVVDAEGRLRTVDDVLVDVTAGLAGMNSDSLRLSASMELFGRAGGGMVNVLRDAGTALEETRERARALGIVVEDSVIRNAEKMQDEFDTASKVLDINLKRAFVDLVPFINDAVELFGSAARGLASIRDLIVDIESKSSRGLEVRAADLRARIDEINEVEARRREALDNPSAGDGFLDYMRSSVYSATAEFGPKALAELQAQLDVVERELANRVLKAPRPAVLELPPGDVPGGPPPSVELAVAERAAEAARQQALAVLYKEVDAETARLRVIEDTKLAEEARTLIITKGLEASRAFEDAERARLARSRAAQDASTAAQRAGGDGASAALDASARILLDQEKATADRQLELARKAREDLIAADKKAEEARLALAKRADEEQLRQARDAAAEALRQAQSDNEARLRAAEEFERRTAALALDRELAVPVISASGRVGEARTLAELTALQELAAAERDLAEIRVAGQRAADQAGVFEDPERLRALAEARVRLTQEEREANEMFRVRAELLREEDTFLREVAASGLRNVQQAQALAERQSEQIRDVTLGLIEQSKGWDSIGDAILGVAGALDKLGVFEGFFNGAFGNSGGSDLGGLAGLASTFGSSLFGGGASASSLGPGPLTVSSVLASARPRAGGGNAGVGSLFQVNEFGREYFKPDVPGRIIPLGDERAAPAVYVNVMRPGPDTKVTTSIKPSQQQNASRLAGAAGRSERYR